MKRGTLIVLIVTAVLVVSFPDTVDAQVDGYHMTGINFNFANPGARARGIGGAFVALADDATAGIANPAGLAFLDRQVTLEYARDQEKAPVGQVTQGGLNIAGSFPDYTFAAPNDPSRVWSDSTTNRLNHASFVLPIPKAHLGLAVYYASLADLKQDYQVGSGLMCLNSGSAYLPGAGSGCSGPFTDEFGTIYSPFDVSTRLQSEIMGIGLGWALGDALAIGGSVAYAKTTLTGTSTTPGIQGPDGPPLAGAGRFTSSVDDNAVMYSLGILYRGSVVGFGASYRSKTTFNIENQTFLGENSADPVDSFDSEFRIPERLAAGLSFFPGDRWVIAAEYVRIPYSTMARGMTEQYDTVREDNGVEYASADVDEYHVGGEYTTFVANRGWSVRAGYWREQTHLIYSSQGYEDPIIDPSNNPQDVSVAGAALLYQELDLNFDHYTVGLGAAFGIFRFDAAVDYSPDAGTDFLLSGVFYF